MNNKFLRSCGFLTVSLSCWLASSAGNAMFPDEDANQCALIRKAFGTYMDVEMPLKARSQLHTNGRWLINTKAVIEIMEEVAPKAATDVQDFVVKDLTSAKQVVIDREKELGVALRTITQDYLLGKPGGMAAPKWQVQCHETLCYDAFVSALEMWAEKSPETPALPMLEKVSTQLGGATAPDTWKWRDEKGICAQELLSETAGEHLAASVLHSALYATLPCLAEEAVNRTRYREYTPYVAPVITAGFLVLTGERLERLVYPAMLFGVKKGCSRLGLTENVSSVIASGIGFVSAIMSYQGMTNRPVQDCVAECVLVGGVSLVRTLVLKAKSWIVGLVAPAGPAAPANAGTPRHKSR
jgi:hypothetical protein